MFLDEYFTPEFEITDKRVMLKVGIILQEDVVLDFHAS